MRNIILAIFLTACLLVVVINSYKLIPNLINDKFRGSYQLEINEEITKSNLYPPKNLKVTKLSNNKIEIRWNFDKKEFIAPPQMASEYGILSGFRIYKNGFWYKDVNVDSMKFVDQDILPNEDYKYFVSALTFDNKIEGEKSTEVSYKTDNYPLNPINFPINKINKYLAEGDSITSAENVSKGEGWSDIVAKNFKFEINNKAVSGSTSSSVSERIEKEVKDFNPDIVTIAIGVNDLFVVGDTLGNFSLSTYAENLKNIIMKINSDKKRNIVLLNIFYVNCCDEKQNVWNREIKAIANSMGVLYVDVGNAMKQKGGKKLLSGDLHPNSEGHKIISETVTTELSKYVK